MHYDFIIVGSGSAGGILAARLSEDQSISVLLIESGPIHMSYSEMPDAVKYGYGPKRAYGKYFYTNSGDARMFVARANDSQPPMLVPRGTTLGGSSSVNAQIFLRGEPDDYDMWASDGNDLWSFDQCLPYFKKLENDLDYAGYWHGDNGPIKCLRHPRHEWNKDQEAFYNSCTKIGFSEVSDHNNPESSGVGPLPFNTLNRIRQSTWLNYVKPVIHRKNLRILSNTKVQSVQFSGTKATSVLVSTKNEIEEISAREIILSAGAISSPQILMLSGIGPALELEKLGIKVVQSLHGVGQNLRDHPQVMLSWGAQAGYEFDQENRSIHVGLRYTATESNLRNDMFIHPVSFLNGPGKGNIFLSDTAPGADLFVGMVAIIYLAKGSGSLKLRTTDCSVQPFLDYNYLSEKDDLTRLMESVRICISIGESSGYKDIVTGLAAPGFDVIESDKKLALWAKQNVRTSHHISSTCKMSPSSDYYAVVNQFGQVHGVSNLRVVDASIMNDCVRANTNLPTMMIAERIADLILEGPGDC